MLMTIAAGLAPAGAGCTTKPYFGISLPVRSMPAQPPPRASAPQDASAAQGSAAASRPSEVREPDVTELTQRIEALAARLPADPPEPDAQAVAPAPVQSSVQAICPPKVSVPPASGERQSPAIAEQGPDTRLISVVPPPVASTAPQPSQPAATQPAAGAGPVANAPARVAPAPPGLQTESTASPVPEALPAIRPAVAPPPPPTAIQPAASPMPSPNPTDVKVEILDVRPAAAPAPDTAAESASAAPNQPAQAEATKQACALETAIADLEEQIQKRPPQPEDELKLQLLYLAAGREEEPAEAAGGIDPIQSELLSAIVRTISASRQAMLSPLAANTDALNAADELRRLLGQQSGVSIPRIALVTKVASYGDYDLISPLRFKAGSEIHAYVYTEVANFRSEPVDGDRLRTLLSERVEVFDAGGRVVWDRHEPDIEDRVRTPRRDFFIPFPIRLPASLAAGEYVLKVTIEDRIGGTTDQQRLSFSIR